MWSVGVLFFPCLLSASLVYRMNCTTIAFSLQMMPILVTFLSRLFPPRGCYAAGAPGLCGYCV